jgi:hypothetical protein
MWGMSSLDLGDRPDEPGELTGGGDRDQGGRLARYSRRVQVWCSRRWADQAIAIASGGCVWRTALRVAS